MKLSTIIICLVMACSIPSYAGKAGPLEINGLSKQNKSVNLSSVTKVETLVQSKKGDSNLRVSILTTTTGGSTDVGNAANLYLTTSNISEMRDARSVHIISGINKLISTKRISAGIYEIEVEMFDFDSTCPEWKNSILGKMKFMIDARQLTADVRNFKEVGEFDLGTITTPIYIEQICQ